MVNAIKPNNYINIFKQKNLYIYRGWYVDMTINTKVLLKSKSLIRK